MKMISEDYLDEHLWWSDLDELNLEVLENLPFEDAEIVVHAHCVVNWLGDCRCSNCGESIDYTSNYCNRCGAKLDEPDERE